MSTTVLEKTTEHLAETVEKVSRAKSQLDEALQDGYESARRAAKRGAQSAEKLLDETKERIRHRPLAAVTTTLFVGLLTGALIGWAIRRK